MTRRDHAIATHDRAKNKSKTPEIFYSSCLYPDDCDPSVWRREGNRWKKHPGGQGEVRVELLDENGSVLPGFEAARCEPLRSDALSHTMSWEGQPDLNSLKDRKIQIRFLLRNAKLYSFRLGS